jgi:hypothetical protein
MASVEVDVDHRNEYHESTVVEPTTTCGAQC